MVDVIQDNELNSFNILVNRLRKIVYLVQVALGNLGIIILVNTV